MGWDWAPVYGESLGSAIENAEEILAKIKTNKFDKQDLCELESVLEAIKAELEKDED